MPAVSKPEILLNRLTIGESAGEISSGGRDATAVMTATLNVASTLPPVGPAAAVALHATNAALIPLNMVGFAQNVKDPVVNGLNSHNASLLASDAAAVASSVAALVMPLTPAARAVSAGLGAASLGLKYGPALAQKFDEVRGQNMSALNTQTQQQAAQTNKALPMALCFNHPYIGR